MTRSEPALAALATALSEASAKIRMAARVLRKGEDEANTWIHRFILREVEGRARTRGQRYWDEIFPGVPPEERARRRIDRMLTRATVSGVVAAAGASTAEVMSVTTDATLVPLALPLGVISVGADMVYTTALRIDLAFDLASIYGVPFARDDVGEISTLLAMALGVELVEEPTRHDLPGIPGETKPWHVARQIVRDDFARQIGKGLLEQSVLRNVIPIAGILVSAGWNQIVLRRFARDVHAAIRQRLAIVRACREWKVGDVGAARTILDGAWLIATADGALRHQEALALTTLIDSLALPARLAVNEASIPDDEEEWFAHVSALDESAKGTLIDVAILVASADGELSTPERRFLRRLGRAVGREVSLGKIEGMVERLRLGEPLHPLAETPLSGALQPT